MERMKLTAGMLALMMVLGLAGCDQRPEGPTGDQPMERSEGAPDSGMTGQPGGASGGTSGMQSEEGAPSQPGGSAAQ